MSTSWNPSSFFTGKRTSNSYAIVILNQPINNAAYNAVVSTARWIVCADGGANRLHDHMIRDGQASDARLPDAVIGDLDSICSTVRDYFESRRVQIVRDPDQYSTDFSKCLIWLRKQVAMSADDPGPILDIVVLGGLGGRVDQGFSLIHYLYRASNDPEMLKGKMYLLSEQSLTFVLDEGINEIQFIEGTFEESIGIVPVAGPAVISTDGLEWDVEDWKTELGEGLMSTSNHIRSDVVKIEVRGKRPLFTVELAKTLQAKSET